MFRNPVVVGGGTPFLPPVTEHVLVFANPQVKRRS
jgi:hypothetical protein